MTISRKNVKRWLENYAVLESGDRAEDSPCNSSAKSDDGISGGQLNRIILDDALDAVNADQPLTYKCLVCRWLYPVPRAHALARLELGKSAYYTRCEAGVDLIYRHVNGDAAGYIALREAVNAGLKNQRA